MIDSNEVERISGDEVAKTITNVPCRCRIGDSHSKPLASNALVSSSGT